MMINKRFDDEQIAPKKKISALEAEIDAEERHKHNAAAREKAKLLTVVVAVGDQKHCLPVRS